MLPVVKNILSKVEQLISDYNLSASLFTTIEGKLLFVILTFLFYDYIEESSSIIYDIAVYYFSQSVYVQISIRSLIVLHKIIHINMKIVKVIRVSESWQNISACAIMILL